MTWTQLLVWVNNPARTLTELRAACAGLGIAVTGNQIQVLARVRAHVASQPDLNAASPWAPAGFAPPAPVPVIVPAPAVPPATPLATPTPQPPDLEIDDVTLAINVGDRVGQRIVVRNGTRPYKFTAAGLPAWLKLDENSGFLSGSPDEKDAGLHVINVTVTDNAVNREFGMVSIVVQVPVVPKPALSIRAIRVPAGEVGKAYARNRIAGCVTGGEGPYLLEDHFSELPTGLTLSPDGVLSGTPTEEAPGPDGTAFTVRVADLAGDTAEAEFRIVINPAPHKGLFEGLADGLAGRRR